MGSLCGNKLFCLLLCCLDSKDSYILGHKKLAKVLLIVIILLSLRSPFVGKVIYLMK